MSVTKEVHLGFEVGTGEPASIPIRHMVITGQTQEAGKTTTLEALVSRAEMPAIAFKTKRFERSFQGAVNLYPYFKERADWQFVQAMLEATMREKMRFERGWIMRASKGAKTLEDVQRNVENLSKKAKGLSADIYYQLAEYLKLVTPQLAAMKPSTWIDFTGPVLHVMELDKYSSEIAALVIRSVLEWVYSKAENSLVIIPEAWEFIPQSRNSPVKLAAVELIRKGAAGGNYIWMDAQDLGGIDKEVLRSCTVWLLGVQRERNEVKRTLDQIPGGDPKPTVKDIMTLELGQFIVCHGKVMKKVYVQPKWMIRDEANDIALGRVDATKIVRMRSARLEKTKQEDENLDYKEMWQQEKQRAESLEKRVRLLEQQLSANDDIQRELPKESEPVFGMPNPETLYTYVRDKLRKDPVLIQLAVSKPIIEVKVDRPRIELDMKSVRGRLAGLISEGFFSTPVNANQAFIELKDRRRFPCARPTVYKECDLLAGMGFLVMENGGYLAVKDMQVNIVK